MAAQQASPGHKFCPECGHQVRSNAFTCPECGVLLAQSEESTRPAVALALTWFSPGAGQMMYGSMALGIVLLVVTIITLYIGWFITMPISYAMTANSAFAGKISVPGAHLRD